MVDMQELLIALVVVLLLFGGRKLPDLDRGLGEGLRPFRRGLRVHRPHGESRPPVSRRRRLTFGELMAYLGTVAVVWLCLTMLWPGG